MPFTVSFFKTWLTAARQKVLELF